MSDERSLPATSRRRAEAIAHRGLPRSSGLTSSLVLLAVALYLVASGGEGIIAAASWLTQRLASGHTAATPAELVDSLRSGLWAGVGLSGMIVVIAFAAAAAADVVQGGLRLSPLPLGSRFGPGWNRLLAGLAPRRWLAESLRWVLPLAVLGTVWQTHAADLAALLHQSPEQLPLMCGELIRELSLRLVGVVLTVGAVQYVWSRWTWERSLRMTPDELREEQRLERRAPGPAR